MIQIKKKRGIKIGKKDGDYKRAVKGEPLKNILDELHQYFCELQTAASNNPFTSLSSTITSFTSVLK